MTPARVFVTGAAGQLGSVVVRTFGDAHVIAHTRDTLDITDPEAVATAVERAAPDVVINCAAFNDVDGAEDAPLDALAVNAFAVRSLARAAVSAGAVLVHYSTDFVFDGEAREPYTEDAAPAPRSTYAASKLLGEWFALDAPRVYVLRVESLFGCPRQWRGRRGTLERMIAAMEDGREVKAFVDRVVTPSYLDDIASATRHLVTRDARPGLYHCVNSGPASWFDVAEEAARQLGITARLVPVGTSEVLMKAARPVYCALSNAKLGAAGYQMPAWSDALRRWLGSRDAASPAAAGPSPHIE